jgi:transcriptional regulator with XRE-family HTH domain
MLKARVKEMVLWDFMAKNNLSQKELARKLDVSAGYISQILCGTRHPSPQLRRRMLELLHPLTFDDLFSIENANGSGLQGDESQSRAGAAGGTEYPGSRARP